MGRNFASPLPGHLPCYNPLLPFPYPSYQASVYALMKIWISIRLMLWPASPDSIMMALTFHSTAPIKTPLPSVPPTFPPPWPGLAFIYG